MLIRADAKRFNVRDFIYTTNYNITIISNKKINKKYNSNHALYILNLVQPDEYPTNWGDEYSDEYIKTKLYY
jgi:hypothetical protein